MSTLHPMDYLCIKISDDCFKVIEFTHPAPKHSVTFPSYDAVVEQLKPVSTDAMDEDGICKLMRCYYLQPLVAPKL